MASLLIIDDEKQVRTFLRRVLEQEGYHVVEARDGREGVQSCREMPIDVVITDIFMDQQDGLATIRVLHREFPQIKVIAMTGWTDYLDFLEDAKAFGAEWVFTKPLVLKQFLAAVREAFARACDGVQSPPPLHQVTSSRG